MVQQLTEEAYMAQLLTEEVYMVQPLTEGVYMVLHQRGQAYMVQQAEDPLARESGCLLDFDIHLLMCPLTYGHINISNTIKQPDSRAKDPQNPLLHYCCIMLHSVFIMNSHFILTL